MTFLSNTFRSIRHKNFQIWTSGAFVSNIGTWVQRVSQDWLVYSVLTNNDASALGTIVALQFLPQLLLLPFSGVAADSLNLRRYLIVTQLVMGFLSATLGVLAILELVRLWHVYLCAALFGSVAALDAPARQIFVAELVGDKDLPNAVALNSMSFNLGRIIGPAVAGMAIVLFGAGWGILFNGLSFFAIVFSLMCLNKSQLLRSQRTQREAVRFIDCLRYISGRKDLICVLVMAFFIGTFGLNFPIYITVMGISVFEAGPASFALLSSIMAMGAVVGAWLSARRGSVGFKDLLTSSGGFCVACLLAALAPSYWIFALTLFVVGIAALTFTTSTNTIIQLSTIATMRGRVMALRVSVALGGTPIGAPVVGWVAHDLGPRWALGVASLSGFIAMIVGIYLLHKRPRDDIAN